MSSQPLAYIDSAAPGAVSARFHELIHTVRQRREGADVRLLEDAFQFAAERHGGQTRKSGEPYLLHPLEVARILADWRLDTVSIVVGLLHDVVEDSDTTVAEIQDRFGPEVARCVDGATKLGRLEYHSAEDRQAETFRKMLLAMVEDIRVILVKLADRLHNMRTLGFLDEERQRKIAAETAEIYAPIALRLGMGKIRGELEDLAFQYLHPEAYAEITQALASRSEADERFLEEIQRELSSKLAEAGIPAKIEGRVKRTYSIYQKLQRQRINIDEVYDLLALRVLTDSEKNCYAALGVIHQQWRPLPGRIKDFIAIPRPNLYQSLHTSVITGKGQRFEVQIRTEEMHRMAEEGICAHWKYKEGHKGPGVDDRRIAWLRQLVEWQQEVQDSSDFLSTLKIDLYPEEVYVFTPKGKLIVLPRGASPIDFAYAIHTEVGHTCVGAKVNGRIVPLKYRLRNGDIVEISTQQGHKPSRDWLALVKTSRARGKIKQWLNAERRRQAEEIGEKLLDKELRRLKTAAKKLDSERVKEVCRDYGCSNLSDLFAQLGYGRYSARKIAAKLAPSDEPAGGEAGAAETAPPAAPRQAPSDSGVLTVKGIDDVLVYRAKCCNPIAGEPIVGYVTRGKGVAVHSKSCSNVKNLMYEAERRIAVEWADSQQAAFLARLILYVDDRPGMLNELTRITTDASINIAHIESRPSRGGDAPAIIELVVEVSNMNQLNDLVREMRKVASVREVNRSQRL